MENNYGISVEKLIAEQIKFIEDVGDKLESNLSEGDYVRAFSELRKSPRIEGLLGYIESLLNRKVEEILGTDDYRTFIRSDHVVFSGERFTLSLPLLSINSTIMLFDRDVAIARKNKGYRGVALEDIDDEDYANLMLEQDEFMTQAKICLQDFTDEGWRIYVDGKGVEE